MSTRSGWARACRSHLVSLLGELARGAVVGLRLRSRRSGRRGALVRRVPLEWLQPPRHGGHRRVVGIVRVAPPLAGARPSRRATLDERAARLVHHLHRGREPSGPLLLQDNHPHAIARRDDLVDRLDAPRRQLRNVDQRMRRRPAVQLHKRAVRLDADNFRLANGAFGGWRTRRCWRWWAAYSNTAVVRAVSSPTLRRPALAAWRSAAFAAAPLPRRRVVTATALAPGRVVGAR